MKKDTSFSPFVKGFHDRRGSRYANTWTIGIRINSRKRVDTDIETVEHNIGETAVKVVSIKLRRS